jgi:murein DD-endopeptidase MepM/ murein hydrolase activator NlpD
MRKLRRLLQRLPNGSNSRRMIAFRAEKGKADYTVYKALPFFLLLFLAAGGVNFAKAEAFQPLPEIRRLDTRDAIFKQYLSDVEASRRLLFSSRQGTREALLSSLTIYSYTLRDGDALMGIAARCNIPYGTMASLNRFSHSEDLVSGKTLLLSSIPGIFIPETPDNDLEQLIFSARTEAGVVLSVPREGKTEKFRFIPGDDFSATERVFFLNRGFRFPLRFFQVSSGYGPRINPVTGRASIHRGLDLAAPEGSEVYAVKNGTVADLGEDTILGKYVIISHDNNWISFYGHLSSTNTVLRAEVQSGGLIARVGTTGQSTGPHLHFELRQNGRSQDPARLLRLFRGNAEL